MSSQRRSRGLPLRTLATGAMAVCCSTVALSCGIPVSGEVEVLVTFEVDTNGILNVTARDRDSGRIYKKSVKVSGELDERAIARIKLRRSRR